MRAANGVMFLHIKYIVILWHNVNTVNCKDGHPAYMHMHGVSESRSVVSNSVSLWTVACQTPLSMELSRPECCSLLQGIVPIRGSNSDLLHGRRLLYHLNHQRIPRMLEWVANPFFRGSSRLRNLTGVSCIAGGFFTGWAAREAHVCVTNAMTQEWWFLRLVCLILKKTCSFHSFRREPSH